MTSDSELNLRKQVRDFRGRIELMNRRPLEISESFFLELHKFGLQEYLKVEKEKDLDKTRKEIIFAMYELHDKLKGKRRYGKHI